MHSKYVDHMGDDLSVVKAAKVSFADDDTVQIFIDDIEAERLGCRSHAALIRYLAKHNHWTPFAHTAITLRMRAPVPIRTQCFKHKFGFVENEESRRYIDCTPTFFIPDAFRGKPTDGAKQGSAGLIANQEFWHQQFEMHYAHCLDLYTEATEAGMCAEQARFLLPQGAEVNWYWTGSLAAFARFYNQRTDSHAQKEIQDLAREVGELIAPLYPTAWEQLTS